MEWMYQPRKLSRSEQVPVRTLQYHVRLWGTPQPDKAPLVLLHGWMDVAASWQFMVDALQQDRLVIAPDWRGFGLSRSVPLPDNYWFADYLSDLDWLLDHYAGSTPVDLVGHSMGGNVAMLYAGIRPERIRRLVNLEGFGMPATQPDQAPARYARWIDETKALHSGKMQLKAYENADAVARRLMKTNPRLAQDKADWLARHWAQPVAAVAPATAWEILGDAAHKITSAHLFRLDETLAIYRQISAPTLAVEASDDSLAQWHGGAYTLQDDHQRLASVRNCRVAVVEDAAHMLHHDQPLQLARLVEEFLG